jgi:hypothetical protein
VSQSISIPSATTTVTAFNCGRINLLHRHCGLRVHPRAQSAVLAGGVGPDSQLQVGGRRPATRAPAHSGPLVILNPALGFACTSTIALPLCSLLRSTCRRQNTGFPRVASTRTTGACFSAICLGTPRGPPVSLNRCGSSTGTRGGWWPPTWYEAPYLTHWSLG